MVGRAYGVMLSQLSNALSEAGLDISPAEYLVIRMLYATDGLRQCEIADGIGKDKASVCRVVASLERRGYVSSVSESHKCRRVFLTDAARDIKQKILEVAGIRHKALMDLGTPAEMETFVGILDRILKTQI